MSKIENVYEIAVALLGEVEPKGESNIDADRLENLHETCGLIEKLVNRVYDVSRHSNRCENSIREAGKYANDFLQNMKINL